MDLFEEVISCAAKASAACMATIVHTNGSIPSFESSRMLVREDGSIVGHHRRRLRGGGSLGGGQGSAEGRSAAQDGLQPQQRSQLRQWTDLRRHAGGVRGTDSAAADRCTFSAAGTFRWRWRRPRTRAGFAIGVVDDREQFANRERFPMAREIYTTFEDAFAEDASRMPPAIW